MTKNNQANTDRSTVERTRGRKWMQIRARILSRNPLCVACLPKIRAAEEVDHILPLHKGGTDDENNLQGLCRQCHAAKTAQDAGRRQIGLDGWPL